MSRPDLESDIEELKLCLAFHITQEDLKKIYDPDDAIFRNVLVGEWEDGK